jgi:hypothetical protein
MTVRIAYDKMAQVSWDSWLRCDAFSTQRRGREFNLNLHSVTTISVFVSAIIEEGLSPFSPTKRSFAFAILTGVDDSVE